MTSKFNPEQAVSSEMRNRICAELANIEREHNVTILYACESGSRAWGFASPNSDYDVRFIYVPKPDWYLSLTPQRDVIECNLPGDLDVVGWELRKALNLLANSNPSILEWLESPIVYMANEEVVDLRRLTDTYYDPVTLIRAHHSLSCTNYVDALHKSHVPYKKYLYTLRSLFAIEYIRAGYGKPPVPFHQLLDVQSLPDDVRTEIDQLLLLKSVSPEVTEGPRIVVLNDFITKLARSDLEYKKSEHKSLDALEAFFRATVRRNRRPMFFTEEIDGD